MIRGHLGGMDPIRWQRLESICFGALERPVIARDAFLDEHCGGDADLRREVATLLAQIESDPSFLERPLIHLSDPDGAAGTAEGTPETSIGGYRIVRRIGRGGMGEVYLALQQVEDVQQSVAIKVMRRGNDTDDFLRRFRLERRILAGLHHPNIARLLDAGATDDGRPYFVMEHVEGQPIDTFCDDRRLSIDQRLELFQVICGAVQHAHQNLVVHRDLKPVNILVSDTGTPKLLDFGIGKVLDDTDTFGPAVETRTNVRVLTPEYAAPEQIAGGAVTTATDVYALGILLHELLTGHHPYVSGGEAVHAIEKLVLEAEPSSPSTVVSRLRTPTSGGATAVGTTSEEVGRRRSTDIGQLRRRLSGDLDNIVLKALRKEPERRYLTAAALSEDIQRHLRGLPVSARADTLGYRARKFIRRHTAGVAAATVAFAALATTTAVTLFQSRRVALESERVAVERDKALEVQSFLMEMFGTAGADLAVGDTVTARQLLDRQTALLEDAYGNRPELKADMLMVLADGYDRLGLHSAGEPLARGALTLRRDHLDSRHVDTAASLTLLGWIIRQTGRPDSAEPLLREAVEILAEAGESERVKLSRSLNDLGVILVDLGRRDEAEPLLRQALDIRIAAHGEGHRSVGVTANNLASVYSAGSKLPEAISTQEVSVRALSESVGPDHQRTLMARSNLAAFRYMTGDTEGSAREYRELLEIHTSMQGRESPSAASVMMSLATVLSQQRPGPDLDAVLTEAESLAREALRIREIWLGASHPAVGEALDRLSNVLVARGKLPEALATGEDAVRVYRDVYGPGHEATGGALSRVAAVLWRDGQVDQAIRTQRQVAGILENSVGIDNGQTAYALGFLCDMLLHGAEIPGDALAVCQRADTALARAPAAARGYVTQVRLRLSQLLLGAGQYRVADSILGVVRASVAAADSPAPDSVLLERLTAQVAGAR